MATDLLGYDKLVEGAMRSVVGGALEQVIEHGLLGGHHFYITFETTADGVEIADHLRDQHPDEMTIVLQHQFSGLEVSDHGFRVNLSFNKILHELYVPFSAVSAFADPSINLALLVRRGQAGSAGGLKLQVAEAPQQSPAPATTEPEPEPTDDTEKVVTLDQFRKK